MKLVLMPTNIGEARKFIERHHSHLHAPVSGLCAVGVGDGTTLHCVAMLGRPVSRMLQAAGCAEVIRVASDGTEHAASKALGAITRAAIALGYRRLVSSILLGEKGTSYRAAGWWPVSLIDVTDGWDRHPRATGGSHVQPGRKVRWEYGPEALPRDPEVDRAVRENAGKVDLRPRPGGMPLFDGRGA